MKLFIRECIENIINDRLTVLENDFPSIEKCNSDSYFTEDNINQLCGYTLQGLNVDTIGIYNLVIDNIDDIWEYLTKDIEILVERSIEELYLINSIKANRDLFEDDFDIVFERFIENYTLIFD